MKIGVYLIFIKEATITELILARQELSDALCGLSETELEYPMGPGEWRVRDLLAHLNHWNRWRLTRIQAIIQGKGRLGHFSYIDADMVNWHVAQAWAFHPLFDVLAEFEASHEERIAFIRSLPPQWTGRVWEFGGAPMDLRRWFGYAADHERSHAEELHRWRMECLKR